MTNCLTKKIKNMICAVIKSNIYKIHNSLFSSIFSIEKNRKDDIVRKIISNIISITYSLILIMLSGIFLMSLMNFKFYVVPTGSMEPNIHKGSLVLINENKDIADINVGDIIVYERREGYNIIHRVISIQDNKTLKVKGDANNVPDADTIDENNFVGKTILVIPALGNVVSQLTLLNNKLLVVAILLAMGMLDYFLSKNE